MKSIDMSHKKHHLHTVLKSSKDVGPAKYVQCTFKQCLKF